jgi:hypothetical protein
LRRTVTLAISVIAAFAPAPAGALAATKGFTFQGRTDQCPADVGRCGRVAFGLSSSLRKVSSFSIEFQAGCRKAPEPVSDALSVSAFATRVGRHAVRLAQDETTSLDLGNGYTGAVTAKLRGSVVAASGTGSGTLRLVIAVTNASGQRVDTCTTGQQPVGWKAKVV